MRLSLPTHRLVGLATTLALACGTLLLMGPASASAGFPGGNGLLFIQKCEDGSACTSAHIWTLDPVSGAQHQLTSGPDIDSPGSVSADGSRVAFTRCPTGQHCRIEIMNSDGSGVTQLTDGSAPGDDGAPSFSPDGSHIVFQRSESMGHHIYLMNPDGTGQTPLTSGPNVDNSPKFSPDGSSIVFARSSNGLSPRINVMPATGGAPTPLTDGGDSQPDFSPDGSQIVFDRWDSGTDTIMVVNRDGTGQHPLTAPAPNTGGYGAVFSPDGTRIAYTAYDSANTSFSPTIVMNADGSDQHQVSGPGDYTYVSGWQPLPPLPAASTPPTAATAASLTLRAPKKESIRKGRLYLFATSSKGAASVTTGKIVVSKLAKGYRLRPSSRTLSANTRTKISLKIPRKALRVARHALAGHQGVKATLSVRVKDSDGNITSKKLKLRLTK
jgi:Tol biopolymer transport system component